MKLCNNSDSSAAASADSSAVFLEKFYDESKWRVTTASDFISLNMFESREKAVDFCRAQNLQITAIIKHKEL